MPARVDQRLTGSSTTANSSGTQTNATATATFAAVARTKHYIQRAILSAAGTVTPARATLVWTYNGAVQTLGIQVGGVGVWTLNFGANPIEGDENTAVTLTIPALGAGGIAEAALNGFSTKNN